MRYPICTLVLLLMPWLMLAQNRPQFVWQGDVDGTAILYLKASRLDVRVNEGVPIGRQSFHFNAPLSQNRQDARLEVIEGRGYAHIIEQPSLENQYTLAVSIEDRQPGASFYSIALYWDSSGREFEHSRSTGPTDTLNWRGRVDEEAMISCQAKACATSAIHGAPVRHQAVKFSRPLPDRDAEVTLERTEGRGDIRLLEQPRESNHYTARVSIRDSMSGSSEYSFTLRWPRAGVNAPEPPALQRGLNWSGVVDGRVRVTVKGGGSFSEVVAGLRVESERADFQSPLPARSDPRPAIKKLRGRGRVEIIEYPSEQNGYRLIFEIDDPEPGAGNYEVEVAW